MKGSYLLLTELKEKSVICFSKNGEIELDKGFYVYVGSALSGLDQRIQRHLRKQKKNHWHIDHLLEHARIIDIFYKESETREECIIAKKLKKQLLSIHGFGCSDCKCNSHLFHGSKNDILEIVDELEMSLYSI
jgi:Uri superfamily endonuclease